MTAIEGKRKLDFSGFYEIQFWDMRAPEKPLKNTFSKMNSSNNTKKTGKLKKFVMVIKSILIPLAIIFSLSLLILLVSSLDSEKDCTIEQLCNKDCKIMLVESIPENLTFVRGSPVFNSTYFAWNSLLESDPSNIDLAVFYWSLKNEDISPVKMPSSWQGEDIFRRLNDIGSSGIKARIAQNFPSKYYPQNDSKILAENPNFEVRSLDFDRLLGGGVLHTKMWLVDDNLYLGSANMDWRSLTQVKEVGVYIQNCPCLVNDMKKVFEVYWILGSKHSQVPDQWPKSLETEYNATNPMTVYLSGQKANVFISSSPPSFNPRGRTSDLDAILSVIRAAEKFVHIAVMDYFPRMLYTGNNTFWPSIDNELRRAALERNVEVRLLASYWNHTMEDMTRWLRSLQEISGYTYPTISVKTKLFVVPVYTEEQRKIPFSRVNHNKYMVTDKTAYIGTSNWSGDYFTNTAGVSLSISEVKSDDEALDTNKTSFRNQLEDLFQRDWNSPYAKPVSSFA